MPVVLPFIGHGDVRKHRAPKGALRLIIVHVGGVHVQGQKAPSAKRCIKTHLIGNVLLWDYVSQKASSAKRCIKTRRSTQPFQV